VSFTLRQANHKVEAVSSAIEALQLTSKQTFDCIITDLQMPGMSGLEFIAELSRRQYPAQIVMVTAHASVATAVEAMRLGAFDYIEKPFDVDQLESLVNRALAAGQVASGRASHGNESGGGEMSAMIGGSAAMQALRLRISRAAPTAETILINGESGTGKELVARAVHAASLRSQAALVSLNCPALSSLLLESELFGHERGAFTGADAARTGRFELAHGGTILLDEVTEIDLNLQAKLLRVLQEKAFERVGSSTTLHVDVRVLATTNRDLRAEVAAGRLREDLFYRLAVIPLTVPPLRNRREDIPELVAHFLARCARRLERDPCDLTAGASNLLVEYHWPGNVRELENIITRACVLNIGQPISADDLQPWLQSTGAHGNVAADDPASGLSMQAMERKLIEATLEKFDGHRAKTAAALGIGLRTLSGKLREYGYAPRAKRLVPAS
jgi:DNA-binding NtrC family response regulator